MPYEDDAPRLSEIGRVLTGLDRKLDDFRAEVRAQLSDKVSKEVYEARHAAQNDRIQALENRARQLQNTIYGSIATILTTGVMIYLGMK